MMELLADLHSTVRPVGVQGLVAFVVHFTLGEHSSNQVADRAVSILPFWGFP